MKTAEERIALIEEVSQALYDGTESWEVATEEDLRKAIVDGVHCHTLGTDLAYLFAALASGKTVQWLEPQTENDEDEYVNAVKVCRGLFPPEHPIWDHIEIVKEF